MCSRDTPGIAEPASVLHGRLERWLPKEIPSLLRRHGINLDENATLSLTRDFLGLISCVPSPPRRCRRRLPPPGEAAPRAAALGGHLDSSGRSTPNSQNTLPPEDVFFFLTTQTFNPNTGPVHPGSLRTPFNSVKEPSQLRDPDALLNVGLELGGSCHALDTARWI
jgi:hypothetical protein